VEAAPRDAEPTLACTDVAGKAAGLGPLDGGLPFEVDTAAARALLARPPPPALGALGGSLAFELVVGVNGRCWVKAKDVASTLLVAQALTTASGLPPEEGAELVRDLLARHTAAT
jgi:exosome complex component RRP40